MFNWRALAKSPLDMILGPNANPRDKLLFAIGTAAIVWYFVSITWIALAPFAERVSANAQVKAHEEEAKSEDPVDLKAFMSFTVTTISGTLATYMGMVLGFGQIAASRPHTASAQSLEITTLQKVAPGHISAR
jgi:hypothetical protein